MSSLDETNMMITSPCCSPVRKGSKHSDKETFERAVSFMTLSPVMNGYLKTVNFLAPEKKEFKDDENKEKIYESFVLEPLKMV